jgi:hypothetical protein
LEILALIFSHVRQKIEVKIGLYRRWHAETSRLFAQSIRGHPTITRFQDRSEFPYKSLDSLYSAWASLPALESITLCRWRPTEAALVHPESLTELLRVPSLRSVHFDYFEFTPALCQATANALLEGTAITDLEFRHCSFSTEGSAAMMANALSRNTSVSQISVVSLRDQGLFDVLAIALPLNSTLRCLDLRWEEFCNSAHISPILLALGKKTGVQDVLLDGFGSMDEPLCTSMQNVLGMNTTLESLDLKHVRVTEDNFDFWCDALSFLRTNTALRSLVVTFDQSVTESLVDDFVTNIAEMLKENASLVRLCIRSFYAFKDEDYDELITALQYNSKLNTLDLENIGRFRRISSYFTDNEDKHISVLLKKNYSLESLQGIQRKDVGSILQLNAAGRRYLIEDGSSISKGVQVLSRVSYETNSVFLHLLENPRLCNRSAVETVSDSTDT